MSMERDITDIVLDTAYKYNIPFTDAVIIFERIIIALEWDDSEDDTCELESWFKMQYDIKFKDV